LPEPSPELRARIENTIRFLTIDAVSAAGIGHLGAPTGLARPALELFEHHLRFDPEDPDWPLRDRFVLSNGHASMLQYALLHLFGYDLGLDDLRRFRKLGSRTPGHPEYRETPGVELTTGPLGQGFGHGVGMALAGRLARSRFGVEGEGPGHHFVYGFVSDGDLMEGVSQESASLAGHLGLGNLIYLYDDNEITIDGPTSIAFSEDVPARFEATGWHVQSLDGEDVEGLRAALAAARAETARPSLVALRTVIGRGIPSRAGKASAHGGPLSADEVVEAKQAAGWPEEPTFRVPEEVRAWSAETAADKTKQRHELDAQLAHWRERHPERAADWEAARARRAPEGLLERLAEGLEGVADATRKHSGKVLERLAGEMPYLVGGSADLAGSAAPPLLKERGTVGPGGGDDPFAGANLHFGVREHAMGAVTNGIALDGTFLPYCGTFLIFSDYLRPALRLAALMSARSLFVFTHDSIFVGEDGPTHQPVEQLDSLRALPNLPVFRPADGLETAAAYAWYAERAEGPVLLALTRQSVAAVERPAGFALRDVWKGGYVVRAVDAPDVVLVATGSEVSSSCAAAALLAEEGVSARVVSVPCLELLQEQPADYVESLVPDDGTPVVAVEAGRGESLRWLAGRRARVHGLNRFGASASYQALGEHFRFDPPGIAAVVREHLG